MVRTFFNPLVGALYVVEAQIFCFFYFSGDIYFFVKSVLTFLDALRSFLFVHKLFKKIRVPFIKTKFAQK